MRVVAAVLSLISMAVALFAFISGATMALKLHKDESDLPEDYNTNDYPVRWDLFHLLSKTIWLMAGFCIFCLVSWVSGRKGTKLTEGYAKNLAENSVTLDQIPH